MGSDLGVTRLLVILFVLSGCSAKIRSTRLQGLLRFGSTLACLEQQSDLQSRGSEGLGRVRTGAHPCRVLAEVLRKRGSEVKREVP